MLKNLIRVIIMEENITIQTGYGCSWMSPSKMPSVSPAASAKTSHTVAKSLNPWIWACCVWAKRLQINHKVSKGAVMFSQRAEVITGSNQAQARMLWELCECWPAEDWGNRAIILWHRAKQLGQVWAGESNKGSEVTALCQTSSMRQHRWTEESK